MSHVRKCVELRGKREKWKSFLPWLQSFWLLNCEGTSFEIAFFEKFELINSLKISQYLGQKSIVLLMIKPKKEIETLRMG
jgi:hypothetical protein